jgi:hypothetical protein
VVRPAWQPITPRGVAAFAGAKIGRLLIVQLFVAALAAGAVCWFLAGAWFPIVKKAIRQLPETGGITNAILTSPRTGSEPLAQNRFVAFSVDPRAETGADVPTDILITFRRAEIRFCSLFGCTAFRYQKTWRVPVTRVELEAAWGAWRSTVLVAASLGTLAGLFAAWTILATCAAPLVRLYAFFKDRQVTLLGSWKLSSAALLPGALIATALIFLYGFGVIDLVRFLLGWGLQWLTGVAYLLIAPLRLPAVQEMASAPKNPFSPLSETPDSPPR